MELFVEVDDGAGGSTDVVLEIEPAATFGDVADALGFLRAMPNGGTIQVARTGQTPRRDDRVADVDVRSGDRLTLVEQPDTDSDGDLVGVTLPRRTRGAWPEGRGYLAERGTAELVHVALPDPW